MSEHRHPTSRTGRRATGALAAAVLTGTLLSPAAQAAAEHAPAASERHGAGTVSASTAQAVESSAPEVIGHRGAAGVAPENTVAAFREAVSSGASFFEIDVQLSADGIPFLFHDSTPARTTNVAEVFPGREDDPITSFTWAELQQLEVGSAYAERYAGERIPHLHDAARVATPRTGVFIEIKSPQNSPGIEAVVAEALASVPEWQRLVDRDKVEVIGFDAESNRRFAALAPEVPLQQLAGTVPDAAALEAVAEYADGFSTNYRNLDADGVRRIHDAGLEAAVYTVNSVEAYKQVAALGVDRVTGDFPRELVRHAKGVKPFPQAQGVRILDSVNDVPGADLQPETGEHVVLVNDGPAPVDVSGYVLRDAAYNVLTVGEGYILEPGQTLRVYTGPGTDTEDAYYNQGTSNVLNNGGDSVGLFTPTGRLLDTFAN